MGVSAGRAGILTDPRGSKARRFTTSGRPITGKPMGSRFWPKAASPKNPLFLDYSPEAMALGLITVFLAFRLFLAAVLGFALDESYTVANSRDLALSYFDHPPMHFWIAHVFMPIFGEGHALRVPFIVLFAGSSWLLYLLTRTLFGAWAGVWALFALNFSAFFTLSAGGWMVPDGPLLFFLLAAALILANAFFGKNPPSPWRTWILAGISIGFAALSKYQTLLFGFSVLLYLVSVPERRNVLLHPAPWIGGLIALAIFSPVLFWNAEHGWVSFAYQGGRGLAQGGLHVGNALVNAAGQAIWILPWIFIPLIIASWEALRAGRAQEQSWFCLCLGLPTIIVFTVIPLWGDRGLPHWPMSGWLMLYPVLGDFLARAKAEEVTTRRRWAVASVVLFVLVAAIAVGHTATGLGKVWFPAAFARGDPTLDAVEWTPLYSELKARGYLDRKDMFVIAPHWMEAGRIDQAFGGEPPVIVAGALTEPKNFAFRREPKSLLGRDALIIGRDIPPATVDKLRPFFKSIEELPPFSFGRSAMPEIQLHIMLAKDLLLPFPPYYAQRGK
jgi:hypothetical protein